MSRQIVKNTRILGTIKIDANLSRSSVIKGILGLTCCIPLGMWGLGALIDLPQALDHYQESDLIYVPVQYDPTGWPIHPESGKRSVRAIPKSTEFLLNAIFFLTYPLAMLLTVIGSCCFKESKDCDDQTYRCVNTIVFNGCGGKSNKKTEPVKENQSKNKGKNGKDIYNDADSAEEKDTEYILYHMRQSQQAYPV